MAKVKTVDFQGRRRQVAYSVDADLARQLEAEADRRGIAAADLAGEILTTVLPGWLAYSIARRLLDGSTDD